MEEKRDKDKYKSFAVILSEAKNLMQTMWKAKEILHPQGVRNDNRSKRMRRIPCKRAAFSMLELLIMLVALSVIIAAFMPVIVKLYSPLAKKIESIVSKDDDTPGEYIIPKSQSDCPNYSVYTDGRTDGKEGGYCVTKWNIGDDDESGIAAFAISNGQKLTYNDNEYTLHYALADGSDKAGCSVSNSTAEPFEADSLCCWGRSNTQTSGEAYTTIDDDTLANPSAYSGRARTICTWQAAVALCDNFAPKGMKKGDWHAPDVGQMELWRITPGSNSAILSGYNSGSNGLQLCDNSSGYSAVQCSDGANCFGTGSFDYENCSAAAVWTRTPASSEITDAYSFVLGESFFVKNQYYATIPYSVRCLAEKVPNNITNSKFSEKQKFSKKLETSESFKQRKLIIDDRIKSVTIKNITSQGGSGGAGYCAKNTTYKTPTSQADCPKAADGSDYTVYMRGKCVTKWNMGDAEQSGNSDFALPSRVLIEPDTGYYSTSGTTYFIYKVSAYSNNTGACAVKGNETVFPTYGLCCWVGRTASICGGEEDELYYSGCERTVCTWYAAKALCSNWAPNGTNKGDWRITNTADMSNWSAGNGKALHSSYSTSTSGLQLCNEGNPGTSGTSAFDCQPQSTCAAIWGTAGGCYPSRIWGGAHNSYLDVVRAAANYTVLSDGLFHYDTTSYYDKPTSYYSVRCSIDSIPTTKIGYFSGGGGESGGQSTDIKIPDGIISDAMGGTIVINRDNSLTDPNNATVGTIKAATVMVYNSNNELIWGYLIEQGDSGASASSGYNSSTGAFSGAAGGASGERCRSYNSSEDTKFKFVSCTTAPSAGTASNSASLEQVYTSKAGNGGSFGSTSGGLGYNNNGSGASPTAAGGIGAGGGGGGCKVDTTATAGYSLVSPTSGGIGYVELEYQTEE